MEGINVLAHQLSDIKIGQILANVRFGLAQHGEHGFIHIDDVEIGIGDHHIGRGPIQRFAHSQVFVIQGLVGTNGGEGIAKALPQQCQHGIELLTEFPQWAAERTQLKLGRLVALSDLLLERSGCANELEQLFLQQGMSAAVAEQIAKK